MADKRVYTVGAFLLSILSCGLIIVSATTDYWVDSDVWIQGNANRYDSLHYGLYGGKVAFRQTMISARYDLHMFCVMTARACAVTCKTTPAARRQEVIYLFSGFRPASLACDDIVGLDSQRPFLGFQPVISSGLYVTINLFLYLQLLFAICSALLALFNTCVNPRIPFFGLQGLALISCVSALMGILVLMIWGIYYASSLFQHHLAFAYVAAQTSYAYPSLGYSYWVLLPAVVCVLGSAALTHLRNIADRKEKF